MLASELNHGLSLPEIRNGPQPGSRALNLNEVEDNLRFETEQAQINPELTNEVYSSFNTSKPVYMTRFTQKNERHRQLMLEQSAKIQKALQKQGPTEP